MELSKGSKIQEGNVVVGFRPSMKIIKNKVAPPFRVAQFDICNGSPERPVFGIDKVASLIDVGAGHKIITLKGSHYSYGDTKLGNGLANAAEYLRGDVELYSKIYEDVSSKLFSRPVVDDFSVDDMIDDSE